MLETKQNSLSYNTWQYNNLLHINRTVNSPTEEQALKIAESIDYATIISLERFHESEINTYKQPGKHMSGTWANFIDSDVIDYYQNRYYYQQKQKDLKGIIFTYNASVTYFEQLHIFSITKAEQYTDYLGNIATWNNITTAFQSSSETNPAKTTGRLDNILHKNQTSFYKMQPEFDITFSNCYLVEMDLNYNEVYGPLAAFWNNTQQIIVLDQNIEPIWLNVDPSFRGVA
jgi:hypothetical protein